MKRLAWIFVALGMLSGCTSSVVFNVDTTADLVDSNPGDGLCSTASGQCSLRAAIQESNASPLGTNVRVNLLNAGTYELTLPNNGNDGLIVTAPVKATLVHGCCNNPSLTRIQPIGINSRIFTLEAGALTLRRLTLFDGDTPFRQVGDNNGGAINVTGSAELFIDQVIIEESDANGGKGGAIYVAPDNLNVVQITDSIIRNNSASGAQVGGAGGVDGHAVVTIVDTLFEGNDGSGGALRILPANTIGSAAHHEILRTTFRNNSNSINSGGGGGARIGLGHDEEVLISNSTFSHNSSNTGGGGLMINAGIVTIEHTTFSENNALNNSNAIFVGAFSEVTLRNNLIVENGTNIDSEDNDDIGCSGSNSLTLNGFNIIESIDANCAFLDPNPVDDDIGPVTANIGFYENFPIGHYPLQANSPAIDNGPAFCVATDQIGNSRPVDGDGNGSTNCDSGSFEYQGN